MVLAYHLVWTLYGSWLPNDPRGSMSRFIASDPIAELGAIHYGRKRVQPPSRTIREFYREAADKLAHPLLTLGPSDVSIVARAFAETIRSRSYTCYACAIMRDHVHLVTRKHKDKAEQMIEQLQQASRTLLIESGSREPDHPVWGGPGWVVYLDAVEDIERTIRYVENNPGKSRQPRQTHAFVTPYDGWPLHRNRLI